MSEQNKKNEEKKWLHTSSWSKGLFSKPKLPTDEPKTRFIEEPKFIINPQLEQIQIPQFNLLTKLLNNNEYIKIVEGSLDSVVNNNINYVSIKTEILNEIMRMITEFKSIQKENITLNEINHDLNEKLTQLKETYDKEHTAFVTREHEYREIISVYSRKNEQFELEIKQKQDEIDEKTSTIDNLKQEILAMKQEHQFLEGIIKTKNDEIATMNRKLENKFIELKKIQKTYNVNFNIHLANSLSSNNNNNKQSNSNSDEYLEYWNINKSPNLNMIFSERVCERLCIFLTLEDIQNLIRVNHLINNAITKNGTIMQFVSNMLKMRFDNIQKNLNSKISYFKIKSENIPDEYIKHSFAKYVLLHESMGEYMPSIINEADIICQVLFKPEDDTLKYENKISDKKGILSKFIGSSTSRKSVVITQPTFKEHIDRYVFIPCDASKLGQEDKRQFLIKANNFLDEVIKAFIKKKKLILDQKDMENLLISSFCKLYVYSKILLQESKELDNLKDYLVNKYEESKNAFARLNNQIEDFQEAFEAEKKLRIYFNSKCEDYERQIHVGNAQILKDQENITMMQRKIAQMETELSETKKDKIECDSKLKLVAKELKKVRERNKDLEEITKNIQNSFIDLKFLFDSLNINIC